MAAGYGKITAKLAEPIDKVSDELVNLINQNIKPPEPVSAEDVFVRAMLVVSDEINSFGGRFPADEHNRLASLLIDSPVLVGHRKDKLPIGRNFHSAIISKDGRQWIKSYFYWLKSAQGAENLQENIDGGIYKECSIGFTYFFPECSVCSDDIRRCNHQPLSKLVSNGVESVVHYNYRQIERVLETSLVYRGALPDTSVSKDLEHFEKKAKDHPESSILNSSEHSGKYQLEQWGNPDTTIIRIVESGKTNLFALRQFNFNRLRHGVRFVAEGHVSSGTIQSNDIPSGVKILGAGEVLSLKKNNSQIQLHLNGILEGEFVLKSVKLEGLNRFLFYQSKNDNSTNPRIQPESVRQVQNAEVRGEICQ